MPVDLKIAIETAFYAHRQQRCLEFLDRALTFADMQAATVTCRAFLRRSGLIAGDVVAISMPRSVEFVVASLSVLLEGAVVMPLPLGQPQARIDHMLAIGGARFILTWTSMSAFTMTPSGKPQTDLPNGTDYLLFTSGTTGGPKCVPLAGTALVDRARCWGEGLGFSTDARVTMFADVGFDASLLEIWAAFLGGSALVIVDEPVRTDPAALRDWLGWKRIDSCWLPTVLAEMMLQLDWRGCSYPRRLITAGERLRMRPPASAPFTLVNAYGPTEATIAATWGEIGLEGTEMPDLGSPLPGVELAIVDEQRRPVAAGEAGELLIGGIGLASGYLGDPVLTQQRFVSLAIDGTSTTRWYATGDHVRLDGDGRLHFIGRLDGQVKVAGRRIELSEIEVAAIEAGCARQAAAVLVGEGASATLWLFVVNGIAVEDIADRLRECLPGYMQPTRIMPVGELPVTERGKVDRPALAQKAAGIAIEQPGPSATMGLLDRIRSLFQSALHRWPEPEDNFFEWGGSSIQAMLMLSELERSSGCRLSFSSFADNPTPMGVLALLPQPAGDPATFLTSPARQTQESGPIPLSRAQEAIWYLIAARQVDRAYHAKAALWLDGQLDENRLRNALRAVVARHEIFRMTVDDANGAPKMVVHPPFDPEISLVDYTMLAADVAESAVDAALVADAFERPFNLSAPPLVRWTLFRVTPTRHVLLQVEHHLVHDGWSFSLMISDLMAFYNGVGHLLPPVDMRYRDYCVHQSQWLAGADAARGLDYWRNQLAGAPDGVPIPHRLTDNPLPKGSGRSERLLLARDDWNRIVGFCRAHRITPFHFWLATYCLALHRLTGATDLPIGSAFANRQRPGLPQLVGLVLNTVVLRCRIEPGMTFLAFVQHVAEVCFAAQAHSELPFETIVAANNPDRSPGENPIFNCFFGFHDTPMPDVILDGLDKVQICEALPNGGSKFDLSVVIIPRSGQLGEDDPVHIIIEYRADLYHPILVEQLRACFLAAARKLADPCPAAPAQTALAETKLTEIDLLADAPQLLTAPAAGPRFGQEPPLVTQLTARSSAMLAHPAVRCAGETLCYADLMSAIDRIASGLHGRGVRQGDLVAIATARDLFLPAVLLAVHRVGAAYLPLDPVQPSARMSTILRDAAPRLLVHSGVALAADAPDLPAIALADLLAGSTDTVQFCDPAPTDLAYVIYTSGSTGKPKGVAIRHAALSNLLRDMAVRLGMSDHDHGMAITPMGFDIAALELFLPLLSGGTVEIVDEDSRRDPATLSAMMKRGKVSLVQMTPSGWNEFFDAGGTVPQGCRLLSGGERMTSALARRLLAAGGPVFNLYGPTETTIWSTAARITSPDDIELGVPIANTTLRLLDDCGRPAGMNCLAELHIGGAGVAQGYWRRPEMTADRFLQEGEAGERFFATGDLVRRTPDGRLCFEGRNDDQVKWRGHRIELGEIEEALLDIPGVIAAAVVLATGADSTKQLVACLVGPDNIDPASLSRRLANRLPWYMTPAVYRACTVLPLNTNGKLDRAALRKEVEADLIAKPFGQDDGPRDDIETRLAALYAEVVGRDRVSVSDGFFAIGGTSLGSIRLIRRIRDSFGLDLDIATFLRLSSVRNVAQEIAAVTDKSLRQKSNVEEWIL